MNTANALRAYLAYVYEYYAACDGFERPRAGSWNPARVLVGLRDQAGTLVTAPPWSFQFLPSSGLFRISGAYLKSLFRLTSAEYDVVRDGFYEDRSGFFDCTTNQARRGWERVGVGGPWSGAVFNALREETLYLVVTADERSVQEFLDPALGKNAARWEYLRRVWEVAALASLGRVPLYWVGTDVTALLGGQARLGLPDDRLLVPRDTAGHVPVDPTAPKMFEVLATVLTNPTGLYFEERRKNIVEGPLSTLWLTLAREHRAAFPMPRQRVLRRLSDAERVQLGAGVLKERMVGEEMSLMARWVAFQVHHEKIMHLFWDNERNTIDELAQAWRACAPLGVDEQLSAMHAQGIRIVGESARHVPKDWSPAQFGVAYLAWSLAKGCGLSRKWPNNLTYAVHPQRRYCVEQGMAIVNVERNTLHCLFPWGAILQGLDNRLYREPSWVEAVLSGLRKRTIEDLSTLLQELRDLGLHVNSKDRGSANRGRMLQTEAVREFAHRHLQAVLPDAARYYPSDRRLEYIAALTAATLSQEHERERRTAQEEQWLSHTTTTYQLTLRPSTGRRRDRGEHHPSVLDYENTIMKAIRAGDGRLHEFLVSRGYLAA